MNFNTPVSAFSCQFNVEMSLYEQKHKIEAPGENSKYKGI